VQWLGRTRSRVKIQKKNIVWILSTRCTLLGSRVAGWGERKENQNTLPLRVGGSERPATQAYHNLINYSDSGRVERQIDRSIDRSIAAGGCPYLCITYASTHARCVCRSIITSLALVHMNGDTLETCKGPNLAFDAFAKEHSISYYIPNPSEWSVQCSPCEVTLNHQYVVQYYVCVLDEISVVRRKLKQALV
jgi:hypothetical protein